MKMTKKFILDDNLFEIFPEVEINYFTVHGIDNHLRDEQYFTELLDNAKNAAQKFIEVEPFRKNPVVDQWRKIYTKFKKKKGARSSIEALLKRVSQGRDFNPINPLVDLYNSVSLTYGIPAGGEDIDKMGNMHLGITEGGDSFKPLGIDKNEPTLKGEICYYDEKGAICRCWNWREAQRTMLTEDTTNAVIVTEAATNEQSSQCRNGIKALQKLVTDYFKVPTSEIIRLDKTNHQGILVK